MRRRSFDVWPAFGDMMFVLFLSSLAVAAQLTRAKNEAKEGFDKCAEGRRLLEEELNRLRTCSGANTLKTTLHQCVQGVFSTAASAEALTTDDCSFSLGEKAIEFPRGEEEPMPAFADEVAGLADCLYKAQVNAPDDELARIEGIYIDGHADPESSSLYNLDLSGRRAHAIYRAYFERVVGRLPADGEDPDVDIDDEERALLQRVFPRSYGEFRSTDRSPAAQERARLGLGYAPDRRVTITIVMNTASADEVIGRPP